MIVCVKVKQMFLHEKVEFELLTDEIMVTIALVENDQKSKARYLTGCRVPSFYMEDFTVLGFPVSGLETVKTLLKDTGYKLRELHGGYHITLKEYKQVAELCEHLTKNGIDTALTDIADTFYQA